MAPKANKKKLSKKAKPATKKKAAKKVVKAVVNKSAAKHSVAKKAAPKKAAAKSKSAKPAARKVPAAHGRISPGFTANDAAATIQWYCDVLGFKVIERWEHEGQFRGAQIGSGGVLINIGQDDWKMGRDRVKGQGTRMYIETGLNIDKYAADIKARGGNLDQEPADGWGVRAFSVTDPDGFKLTFMSGKK